MQVGTRRALSTLYQRVFDRFLSQPAARILYPTVTSFHDLDPTGPYLSYAQRRAISLSSAFIPATLKESIAAFDIGRLMRRVQWALATVRAGDSTTEPKMLPTLRIRSDRDPPDDAKHQTAALHYRLNHAVEQLKTESRCEPPHAYTQILDDIQANPDIVICVADKGLGVCRMSAQQYDSMCQLYLSGAEVQHLTESTPPSEVAKHTHKAILTLLEKTKSFPTAFEPYEYIRAKTLQHTKLPRFYALAKVHKGLHPLKPRPIIAAFAAPTTGLSTWLSRVLIPVTQRMPHYIRDSSHLVSILKDRKFPTDSRIYTGDVESMYPSMVKTKTFMSAMRAISFAYGCDNHPAWTKIVPDAIRLLFDYNYFTYEGTIYGQTKGIAMGSNASSPLSDLYLVVEEHRHLKEFMDKTKSQDNSLFYARFRDDMILICPPRVFNTTAKKFTTDLATFRQVYPTDPVEKHMNISWTPGSHSQVFLDCTISLKPNGYLEFKPYSKVESLHLYMPPFSGHNAHIHIGTVLSQLTRLHRISSTPELFYAAAKDLFSHLSYRGYGSALLAQAINKWLSKQPETLAFPGPSTPLKTFPLVGERGMPYMQAPPMVLAIPDHKTLTQSIRPILRNEYHLLQDTFGLPDALHTYFSAKRKRKDV